MTISDYIPGGPKPDDESSLLPKNRKAAVYWMRECERHTELFGKMAMHEIACGQALDRSQWTTRTTAVVGRVTCKECYRIARAKP